MTAVIVAMHCLPLPLLVVADGAVLWLLGAAAGLSLIFQLHQQRPAAAATRLEATTANGWLLYRGAKNGHRHGHGHGHERGHGDKVNLIEQMNLGGCVLLLMGQGRRRFRLVVRAGDQTRDQWHRLRVLRAAQSTQQRPLSGNSSGR